MYSELDAVLNVPVRLAIVSILIKVKQADFNYLMENISALKKKHSEVSFSTLTLQQIPYLKYAFRALVIQKVKGRIRSIRK